MEFHSPDQAIRLALSHHQAGRLPQAEAIYREVLSRYPNHADALHLLGVVAHQAGNADAAIELIGRATQSNPNEAVYHCNLGKVLSSVARFDQAAEEFRRAIALKSDFVEAHYYLGNALRYANQFDEAIAVLGRALELSPRSAEILYELGICRKLKGDFPLAIDMLRQSIAVNPNLPETYNGLAGALREIGDVAQAEAALRQAIALKPDFADAHNNLGSLLRENHRALEAIAEFKIAIALQPDNPLFQYNLGTALFDNDRLDEAIACFRRALALKLATADVYNNLANALRAKGTLDEAETAFRRALQISPNHAEAHNNFSNLRSDQGHIDQAIAECRKATNLQPSAARMRHNLGLMLLLDGQFEEGWVENEWRVNVREVRVPAEDDPRPRWDGSALNHRRILIYAEQGFGDSIHFCRYLPMLKQRGAGEIIFQCPQELVQLLSDLPEVRIIGRDNELPEFDVRSPLLSLPYLFETTLQTIPAEVGYLKASPERVKMWRARMNQQNPLLKVGLAWAGRPEHKNDRNRSIPLKFFAPLLVENAAIAQFFSLQKGSSADQLREFSNNVIDWTNDLHDFADTAALIENLDLVISADTSVAHLAGALGKPVWTLLPFAPDWRWLLHRTDSPWYPTMKLFRQPQRTDWPAVVSEVAQALRNLAAEPRS